MLRMIPPAGTPTPLGTVLSATMKRLSGRKSRFEDNVRDMVGAKYVFLVNSGRAAQTLILRAMHELRSERDEVVVPAYTCYTVPASVVKAGLKVRPVDIDPATMDYDEEALRKADLNRALAVNSSNLFGIISNWCRLNEIVQTAACYRIDDAAQSFGATTGVGQSGMLGDVGFFSLGRGKNLSTYSGGLIVTNDSALGERLSGMVSRLNRSGPIGDGVMAVKLAAYSLLLRPRLYWLPASLPFIGLGETIYDESFSIQRLSRLQESLGELMIGRLRMLNDRRAAIADKMAAALVGSGEYVVPGYDPELHRPYLRLPVLAADKAKRDEAIKKLRSRGIGASFMYPDSIANIPQLRPHLTGGDHSYPGAREVVNRLFTLPTHGYMTSRDAELILECLL
jgi:perosamine synthetase